MVCLWVRNIGRFGQQIPYAYFGQFGTQEIELPMGMSFQSKV